jgi:hypothetical protein
VKFFLHSGLTQQTVIFTMSYFPPSELGWIQKKNIRPIITVECAHHYLNLLSTSPLYTRGVESRELWQPMTKKKQGLLLLILPRKRSFRCLLCDAGRVYQDGKKKCAQKS